MAESVSSETNPSANIISFKDLTDKVDLVIKGHGDYIIGLSVSGSVIIEQNDLNICMPLLFLTLHENGGCTLSSANRDLPCYLNNSTNPLSGEVNLVDGSIIETADRKLKFFNGPIPKRRRKLPKTPGMAVGEAPAKPGRSHVNGKTTTNTNVGEKGASDVKQGDSDVIDDDANVEADKRWLEASWCMLDLPESDQYMFKELYTPEQISILAASYLTKQLRLFTDATITERYLDNIFGLFMDTVTQCQDTYMDYLAEISRALTKIPDRSNTVPMHGPAVKFLTELLKQCMDPVNRVVLILDMLRTFSHFDGNVATMVRCQTNAAVLGSMSAYVHHLKVQQYAVDIIAKLATFKPTVEKKAPVREVAVDLVMRAVQYHTADLHIARASCRVLANLASTLIGVLNQTLESEPTATESGVCEFLDKYEELLDYVFKYGTPFTQAIMKTFDTDIGVNTEGRKFIFHYAKFPQTQSKKTKWMAEAAEKGKMEEDRKRHEEQCKLKSDVNLPEAFSPDTDEFDTAGKQESENEGASPKSASEDGSNESNANGSNDQDLLKPSGILKRVRSYENLRSAPRRLSFFEETVGGSYSDTDTFSSNSDAECDGSVAHIVPKQRESDQNFKDNVVKHWVRQTLKRRCNTLNEDTNESAGENEHEFLSSLDAAPQSEYDGDFDTSTENMIVVNRNAIKYDYKGSQNNPTQTVNSEDLAGDELKNSDDTTNVIPSDQTTDTSEKDHTEPVNRSTSTTLDVRKSVISDVVYLGKLVRTQIVTYVGTLVFKGADSTVLMVIDKPIKVLLEEAAAPRGLIEFALSQYGDDLTLMDLEPALVINIIDAVRYRSVTMELVQSAVLTLTRNMSASLMSETVNTTMLFFKSVFSDPNLKSIIADDAFLKEFRACFQNATERMEKSHSIEEIRNNLGSHSFVV